MSPDPAALRFTALGTTAVVLTTAPGDLAPAAAAARREIDGLDRACSRFRDDSDLTAVNAGAGRPVRVSALLVDAVEAALRAAQLTDGRVDPTVGTALQLIGYDRDFRLVPSTGPAPRLEARPVPGWHQVRIDRAASTVRVPAGVSLDLGATAKALGADRAAAAAATVTGAGVLVGLGGDIATAGPGPEGGWAVRVTDDHAAPAQAPGQTVSLTSGGLATSSTTVRRWDRGGRSLHHLIDPATGLPVPEWWRTVSVAAATCLDANIASTAAMILGRDGPTWLTDRRLPARLVDRAGAVTHLGGWRADERVPACP